MRSLMLQQMIWTSRNQVQNCTPGTDVPHLAVSSTPEEWASFGHDLFRHKRYPQAMHCFARAFMPRMEAICEAFQLREVARAKVNVASSKAQEAAFLAAAVAFTNSANDAPPGRDKLQYYRNAAECYVRAGDDRKAATAYLSAEEYDLGARRFRKAGLFDETLEVLHEHSQKVSSDCSEELYTVCRLFYCRQRDGKRCVLCDLRTLYNLTDVSELGHVCHYSHRLKRKRNSSRTMTLILPGRSCWSLMEDTQRLPTFICLRTDRWTQLKTS